MGRLGGTAYELGELELDIQGSPFAPASMLLCEACTAVGARAGALGGPAAAHADTNAASATAHTRAKTGTAICPRTIIPAPRDNLRKLAVGN